MQRKASSGLQASWRPAVALLGPSLLLLSPPCATMLILFLQGWQVVIKMSLAEKALIVPPYKSAIRDGAMNSARIALLRIVLLGHLLNNCPMDGVIASDYVKNQQEFLRAQQATAQELPWAE